MAIYEGYYSKFNFLTTKSPRAPRKVLRNSLGVVSKTMKGFQFIIIDVTVLNSPIYLTPQPPLQVGEGEQHAVFLSVSGVRCIFHIIFVDLLLYLGGSNFLHHSRDLTCF